nr:uncharacterized protein LOC128701679 isoform X2 [Cherax quadricarinatus]
MLLSSLVLMLLPLLCHAATLTLPTLTDSKEPSRRNWPMDNSLQTLHWLKMLLGEHPDLGEDHSVFDVHKSRPDVRPILKIKRTEGKIPTMDMGLGKRSSAYVPYFSLGVLSDMRKFFNELRTNLDSVEEVAALSQEQGGVLDPAEFLALLAKHGARMQAKEGSIGHPPPVIHTGQHMFGYATDDQPYAHSGLGK